MSILRSAALSAAIALSIAAAPAPDPAPPWGTDGQHRGGAEQEQDRSAVSVLARLIYGLADRMSTSSDPRARQLAAELLEVVTRPTSPRAQPGDRAPASRARPAEPGGLIDLADWSLTLPTGEQGHPESVEQPELDAYSGEHFRLTTTGDGVVFSAPAGGVTTPNSHYPRSELREMSGTEKAAWSNTTGRHVLLVQQAVTAVPSAKPEVVTAQIHDGSDDVLQIRLDGAELTAQFEDGKRRFVLDPAYELGTPFEIAIVATEGRVVVYHDGEPTVEHAITGSGWYFKTGTYVQSNPDKGDQPDATGEVVIYDLQVIHG